MVTMTKEDVNSLIIDCLNEIQESIISNNLFINSYNKNERCIQNKLYDLLRDKLSKNNIVAFEFILNITPTQKTRDGKASCDIYINCLDINYKVGIEIKYPRSSCSNEDRMSILLDIENLEVYKKCNHIDEGFLFVYTGKLNYVNNKTRSSINIGNNSIIKEAKNAKNHVVLDKSYKLNWGSKDSHHFLTVRLSDGF